MLFSFLSFRMYSHNFLLPCGSSPRVGSSKNSTLGSCISARKISSLLFIPPLNFFTSFSANSFKSALSRVSLIFDALFSGWRWNILACIHRFSLAVRSMSNEGSWNTIPMLFLTSSGCFWMSKPFTVAFPCVGCIVVASIESSVVFPAPLGPKSPKISPSFTSRLTFFTASKFPNFFTKPLTQMLQAFWEFAQEEYVETFPAHTSLDNHKKNFLE